MLASAVPAELEGACTMKVCTKCGWQNEDDEAKCFQCFADLSAGKAAVSKSRAAKQDADAAAKVEFMAPDNSSEVWFDPDMRPIEHDTPDQILPGAVEIVEEEV